jgi:adenosylmethionine-8-amino-7-oxononanoate aminotransferase
MSFILHRQMTKEAPRAVGGDGVYLVDETGRRYLDGASGAAVSCLGHSDADIVAAVQAQVAKLAYSHTSFFSSEPAEEAAELLVAYSSNNFAKVFFTSSGSEAVEAAIKFARQHFVEKGEPERRHIIGRWQSYHGNTLGALSAGGNRWRRTLYGPLLLDMHHISACYAYRGQHDGETADEYGLRMADALEQKILELGPETVAAFIAEPVVGATLGAVVAPSSYFPRIREICDRYGVLLIFDEIMCGMGRTGTLFAYEQEGIVPDLVCVAKGLGAGYQPIAAMLISERACEPIAQGSGAFLHGHTYQAHPVACAAAVAVLRKISDPALLSRVTEAGQTLIRGLRDRIGNNPYVGDIRGRGLFAAVEFVSDASSKAPFPPEARLNGRIKQEAMRDGLLCYAMGGTLDGRSGDHVLFAPPFIVSDTQISTLVETFATAMTRALDQALATPSHTQ